MAWREAHPNTVPPPEWSGYNIQFTATQPTQPELTQAGRAQPPGGGVFDYDEEAMPYAEAWPSQGGAAGGSLGEGRWLVSSPTDMTSY